LTVLPALYYLMEKRFLNKSEKIIPEVDEKTL